jgi:hypothetical protein
MELTLGLAVVSAEVSRARILAEKEWKYLQVNQAITEVLK